MDPILVTAHCNKVVLAVWEHGGVVLSAVAATVRVKDAIGFHSANEDNIFLKRLVPQGFAGIPAIHLEDDAGICLKVTYPEVGPPCRSWSRFLDSNGADNSTRKNHPY